jgi:hypothetical protein
MIKRRNKKKPNLQKENQKLKQEELLGKNDLKDQMEQCIDL